MKLTKLTDHSFRILIYLAARSREDLATISEVTTAFSLSKDSVMKMVQKLAKAGYIEAIRGKSGGMRLGKPASEINLRAVVELLEPTIAPVNCNKPACELSSGCQLQGILFAATEQFLHHLGQYTLADVVQDKNQTVQIIQVLEAQIRT